MTPPRSAATQLDGLLVVDKPTDMTSHDVVAAVRRAAGQRKVGHGGTLDPIATGVLPLLLGRATRLLRFLPDSPKVYRTRVRLGVETETGDRAGAVLRERPADHVTDGELAAALERLTGDIEQLPPMYSAKKIDGVRLYRAARAGRDVERRPIQVQVESIRRLERNGRDVVLEIHCSPGTYIRAIAVDLGRLLGVGATVFELRRLRSGSCGVEQARALDRLSDRAAIEAELITIDAMPLALPDFTVNAADSDRFLSGLSVDLSAPASGARAVRDPEGHLLGIGEAPVAAAASLRPRVVLGTRSR